jgi:CRP/FNR family cyclic AMP-dependent transcriptional regulator
VDEAERVARLGRSELFCGLPPPLLARLAAAVVVRALPAGALLFQEGEAGAGVYVVLSGRVRVYHALADGREYTMEIVSEGGTVAIVCLFAAGPYPASAEAYGDATVAFLARETAEALVRAHPELALALLRVLSERLRRAHERTADLAVLSAHERVAALLLRLADEVGGEGLVTVRSRAELAKMAGTVRETVARALSDFQRHGAVELRRDGIVVHRERLRRWAGLDR